uniref:Uncharacterized protein n=1 Tax=Vitis vinifera TaxID=29760 RepID=A5BJD5_VITVI|nr:hypothetical protein VITISV_023578 [Vitis vinifera]
MDALLVAYSLFCRFCTIFEWIGSFQNEDLENYEAAGLKDTPVEQDGDAPVKEQSRISEEIFQNGEYETSGSGYSFLVKVAIALGVAVTATIISAGFKQPVGSSFGFQRLAEDSSSSVLSATPVGFTFKAFGYRIVLPEYTPGYAPTSACTLEYLIT